MSDVNQPDVNQLKVKVAEAFEKFRDAVEEAQRQDPNLPNLFKMDQLNRSARVLRSEI